MLGVIGGVDNVVDKVVVVCGSDGNGQVVNPGQCVWHWLVGGRGEVMVLVDC